MAALAVVTLLAVSGCGRAVIGGVASGERSPQPTPSTPAASPNPAAFEAGSCTTSPPTQGTASSPAPDTFQTGITVPVGWAAQDTAASDTTDFLLTAPLAYAYQPTTLSVSAPLPTGQGDSPGSYLQQTTSGVGTPTASGQPCTIGSDAAAFVSFANGSTVGYLVVWFHFGDAFVLQLKGNGGLDARAVQDAKYVLGSVAYSHNVPPPGYTPATTK